MCLGNVAVNKDSLTKRLRRFFEETPDDRKPLFSFMNEIQEVGETFVFGGLIRDICLRGVDAFRSDIDIVVKIKKGHDIHEALGHRVYERNKFGGYRIRVAQWCVDVWEFENTWAFASGLVEPQTTHSLLDTTFFNWDASLYNISAQKLYHYPNYFEDLSSRLLDVNLKSNPNLYGAFVRALRLISKEHASTRKDLSEFIIEYLKDTTDEQILEYEWGHFNYRWLDRDVLANLRARLEEWDNQDAFLWLQDPQLDLFASNNSKIGAFAA